MVVKFKSICRFIIYYQKKVCMGTNQNSPRKEIIEHQKILYHLLDVPVLFITHGHVRDRDISRLMSVVMWQHATLINYEIGKDHLTSGKTKVQTFH